MKKDIVNLYVSALGCPKCSVLKGVCENSDYIKQTDFKIIEVNPNNSNDTDLQLLLENGIKEFPVLLVNDDFYDFSKAMLFIRR